MNETMDIVMDIKKFLREKHSDKSHSDLCHALDTLKVYYQIESWETRDD